MSEAFGFEPTDDQKTLIEAVRRFSAKELRPHVRTADDSSTLPEAATRQTLESALRFARLV